VDSIIATTDAPPDVLRTHRVADWVPQSTNCVGWGNFSNDDMCLAGASTTSQFPGALVRGGAFAVLGGPLAGPFAVRDMPPSQTATSFIGFRCTR
jgi:hypothetical protein